MRGKKGFVSEDQLHKTSYLTYRVKMLSSRATIFASLHQIKEEEK